MMRRRAMVGRRGPGLVGTVARTAVIAGTATAVSGAVIGHQQQKTAQGQAEEAAQQQAAQEAAQNSADLEAMKGQMAAMQAQQVQQAVPVAPAPAPAPAAAPAPDLISQLQQLSALKTAGALTDAEFEAAKAKLLA
jgi:hypothetical protein